MSMIDLSEVERKIASRIDSAVGTNISVSDMEGGLVFRNVGEVMDFAKMMAVGGIAVRKHLRGNVGACLAICVQALEWRFSPYAVANKSYAVNDQLAYEAQLIAAVVLTRAPIADGEYPDYVYEGQGQALKCTVSLKMRGGKVLIYESPTVGSIKVKNSPLWTSDPEQQLGYYSIRAWARRHMPHIILGVFSRDELPDDDDRVNRARNVTPRTLQGKLDALASPKAVPVVEHDPETGEVPPKDIHDGEPPTAKGDRFYRESQTMSDEQKEANRILAEKILRAEFADAEPDRSGDGEDDEPEMNRGKEDDLPGQAPQTLREATIDKLRAAFAAGGKSKFARARGGLSKPEHDSLVDDDWKALNATIAKMEGSAK